jgi:hypothetical protein
MTEPDPEPQPNDPLRGFRTVQQETERDVSVMLEQAASDIRKLILEIPDSFGGAIRKAQLDLILGQIRVINERLWNSDLLDRILASDGQALQVAERAMGTLNRYLLGGLPPDVAEAVSGSLRASAQSGVRTVLARRSQALSPRVWQNSQLANGRIEQLIRSGLVGNLSAKEMAKTVYQFASPRTPGGQSYAAMRLARTEINNAFHEQQRDMGHQIGVLGVKWNLSGSHPTEDECNEYAEHDEGLGEGVWNPDAVPDKPHPHCFCYLSYLTLTSEKFADAMLSGQFDDEIDRRTQELIGR